MGGHTVVTGGAGFIGSTLTDALLARGERVTVVDEFNDYYDPAIKRSNLVGHHGDPRLRVVHGDVCDEATWAAIDADDCTALVHLAARAGVRPSLVDPALYARVNLLGTAAALRWAVSGARPVPFVFASSSSVYGDDNEVPFREDARLAPVSPYGATKAGGEELVRAWGRCWGLPQVSLRFFTVYGPRQRPDLAIHKFARLIEGGVSIPVFGDGSAARDYTHVRDTVAGVLAASDRLRAGTLRHDVYNLGSDRTVRLDAMIAAIEAAVGRPAVLERLPMQQGDVVRTWADVSRARSELGYGPSLTFAEGVADFVRWMRAR